MLPALTGTSRVSLGCPTTVVSRQWGGLPAIPSRAPRPTTHRWPTCGGRHPLAFPVRRDRWLLVRRPTGDHTKAERPQDPRSRDRRVTHPRRSCPPHDLSVPARCEIRRRRSRYADNAAQARRTLQPQGATEYPKSIARIPDVPAQKRADPVSDPSFPQYGDAQRPDPRHIRLFPVTGGLTPSNRV